MHYEKDQSNYMVSIDGINVMDLPVQYKCVSPGPQPKIVKSLPETESGFGSGQKPKTPVLIPPLKYIVYNNPQGVYDFLMAKGYRVNNTIPSTYQFAKIFIRERGDNGVLELVGAAHPDKSLILKATGHKEDAKYCGTSSFDGEGSDAAQSTDVKSDDTKKNVASDTKGNSQDTSKNETLFGIQVNSKTIIVVLVIILFFVLITRGGK